MGVSGPARMSTFSAPRSKICFCSTTVVAATCEASKESSRMVLDCAILRPLSVGATKACARVLLSPHNPLSPTAPMKNHRTHTATATDARATTLLFPRELSIVLDAHSQRAGEKANDAPSL